MGDYVSKKGKSDDLYQNQFLFSSPAIYCPDNAVSTNFSFHADTQYIDLATILLQKYLAIDNKPI
jgi:hypothetical protein